MSRLTRSLKQISRVLTGRQPANRGVTVYPDDVFIVSYPRSGNTWTRFLIGNFISQNEPVTFSNLESKIPEIHFNPDHRMRRLPRPRILKSHECFDPRYPRIIYIVRDPRDVAVSYYHHNVKAGNLPDQYPIDEFIPRFMAGEFDARWGTWAEHVLSWLCLRRNQDTFLLLSYEEMKKNPVQELRKIADFLVACSFPDVEARSERLMRAVDLSSPERMRELERIEARNWVLTKKTRQDKPFVRSARVGGWQSALSEASVARIEGDWGNLMTDLGYELHAGRTVANLS